MNKWIKNLCVFICIASLLATITPKPQAEENTVNLSGTWVSLQYGTLTFVQNGNAFTAK
jgi:hypothetical protein